MADDFKIQRGTATIATSGTSVTITAGTEYTAPTGEAFIRITNAVYQSGGVDGQNNLGQQRVTAGITNPGNLGTSITFRRATADTEVDVTWEIIEYQGSSGGANEFKVRANQVLAFGATNATVTGSTVSGITTDADVVPFITAIEFAGADNGNDRATCTAAWNSGTDDVTLTRGDATGANNVTVSVVEFTGSNWTVERVAHAFTAAGSAETETLTTSVTLTRAMLHNQLRFSGSGLDEQTCRMWISSTTQVSFQLQSGADVSHNAVAWVISNSQTDGTPMVVQRASGSVVWSGDPDVEAISITTTGGLSITSLGAMTGHSSGTGTATNRAHINHIVTSTSNVNIICCDAGQTWTYNFEVVEWPTVAAVGGATTPFPIRRRAFAPLLAR